MQDILTKGVVNANGPSHSLLSLNGWEYLCGVLESDRSLTQRVGDGEEVDESGKSVKRGIATMLDELTTQLVLSVHHGCP